MVLNKNSHTAKAEGETFSIDVTSRAIETDCLNFNVAPNTNGERREGTITLKGGKVTQTIKVKQSAASTDEL
ncbi:MAG: BACON domain-containing protein [Bacteroidales bacterium]|nr:BACON domain-containing protein [Bacteroidales bacterium]